MDSSLAWSLELGRWGWLGIRAETCGQSECPSRTSDFNIPYEPIANDIIV